MDVDIKKFLVLATSAGPQCDESCPNFLDGYNEDDSQESEPDRCVDGINYDLDIDVVELERPPAWCPRVGVAQ